MSSLDEAEVLHAPLARAHTTQVPRNRWSTSRANTDSHSNEPPPLPYEDDLQIADSDDETMRGLSRARTVPASPRCETTDFERLVHVRSMRTPLQAPHARLQSAAVQSSGRNSPGIDHISGIQTPATAGKKVDNFLPLGNVNLFRIQQQYAKLLIEQTESSFATNQKEDSPTAAVHTLASKHRSTNSAHHITFANHNAQQPPSHKKNSSSTSSAVANASKPNLSRTASRGGTTTSGTGSIRGSPFIRTRSLELETLTPAFLTFSNVSSELSRVNADLKLAAELGQCLLDQNHELEESQAMLTTQLKESEEKNHLLRKQLEESLERNAALARVQNFQEAATISAAALSSPSFRLESTDDDANGNSTDDQSESVYEFMRRQIIETTRAMHNSVQIQHLKSHDKEEKTSSLPPSFNAPPSINIDTSTPFSAEQLRQKLKNMTPTNLLRVFKQLVHAQQKATNLRIANLESSVEAVNDDRNALTIKLKSLNTSIIPLQTLQSQITALEDERASFLDQQRDQELHYQTTLRHRIAEVEQVTKLQYEERIKDLEKELKQSQQASTSSVHQLRHPSVDASSAVAAVSPSIRALHGQLKEKIAEIQQLKVKLEQYEAGLVTTPPSSTTTKYSSQDSPLARHLASVSANTAAKNMSRSAIAPEQTAFIPQPISLSSSAASLRNVSLALRLIQLPAAFLSKSQAPRHLLVALFVRSPRVAGNSFHYVSQTERQKVDPAVGDSDIVFQKQLQLKKFMCANGTEFLFSIYSVADSEEDDVNAATGPVQPREKVGSVNVHSYHLLTAIPGTPHNSSATTVSTHGSNVASGSANPPLLLSMSGSEADSSDEDDSSAASKAAILHKLNLELLMQREKDQGGELSVRELQRQVMNERREPIGGGLTRLIISAAIEPSLSPDAMPPAPPTRLTGFSGMTPLVRSANATPQKPNSASGSNHSFGGGSAVSRSGDGGGVAPSSASQTIVRPTGNSFTSSTSTSQASSRTTRAPMRPKNGSGLKDDASDATEEDQVPAENIITTTAAAPAVRVHLPVLARMDSSRLSVQLENISPVLPVGTIQKGAPWLHNHPIGVAAEAEEEPGVIARVHRPIGLSFDGDEAYPPSHSPSASPPVVYTETIEGQVWDHNSSAEGVVAADSLPLSPFPPVASQYQEFLLAVQQHQLLLQQQALELQRKQVQLQKQLVNSSRIETLETVDIVADASKPAMLDVAVQATIDIPSVRATQPQAAAASIPAVVVSPVPQVRATPVLSKQTLNALSVEPVVELQMMTPSVAAAVAPLPSSATTPASPAESNAPSEPAVAFDAFAPIDPEVSHSPEQAATAVKPYDVTTPLDLFQTFAALNLPGAVAHDVNFVQQAAKKQPLYASILLLSHLLGVAVPESNAKLSLSSQLALTGVLDLFKSLWLEAMLWYGRNPHTTRLNSSNRAIPHEHMYDADEKAPPPPSTTPPPFISVTHSLQQAFHESSGTSSSAISNSATAVSIAAPTDNPTVCSSCNADYSFFRREYTCNMCGLSFCDDCTRKRVEGHVILSLAGELSSIHADDEHRCCDLCFAVVQAAAGKHPAKQEQNLHITE